MNKFSHTNSNCKLSKFPEYTVWIDIKKRCYNSKSTSYKRYGARGIKVCDSWLKSFKSFIEDMGNRPTPKHQIDRIDNSKHYSPDNCRWVTKAENAQNRRTTRLSPSQVMDIFTSRLQLKELANIYKVSVSTIHDIKMGKKWKKINQP